MLKDVIIGNTIEKTLFFVFFFILNIALIPLFDAILKNIKSKIQGRSGVHIFQTYRDLYKLFVKKENFNSQFTSIFSKIAPIVVFGTSFSFLFFIDFFINGFSINIIFLFHILLLGAFFLILYGLDNATYFGGLGASRETFTLVISEPIIILFIFILYKITGSLDISNIFSNSLLDFHFMLNIIYVIILLVIIFFILLIENKRFPFDNPSTHLELTMIHEAMLLETSGKTLAIMELSSKAVLFGFINLIILLFSGFLSQNFILFIGQRILSVFFILLLLGIFEVFISKMRIFKYQNIFSFLLIIEILILLFFYFMK